MRVFREISLCVFFFCNLYMPGFGDTHETLAKVPTRVVYAPLAVPSDTLWTENLETFQKLLQADLNAARTELQKVAEDLFGEHTLREEWVVLFFRISKEGTEEISDAQRVMELEMRMLTDIALETQAFDKYAPFLQHLQKTYQTYEDREDDLRKQHHDQTPTDETQTDPTGAGNATTENGDTSPYIQENDFKAFYARDPDAARKQLIKHVAKQYNNNPLAESFVDALLKVATQEMATYPDMIAFTTLHLQLMKQTDAETYKEQIQATENTLKQFKSLEKLLKKQGSLETEKVKVSLDFELFLPRPTK